MKSPLAVYDEYAKKHKMTGKKQVHLRQKQAYATEQVQQMQLVGNRLLCDIVFTAAHLEVAKDDTTKEAVEAKLRDYEKDLRQISLSLDYALALAAEFDKQVEATGEER